MVILWNDAIWLAKKEFKQHWIAVLFTFIFSSFFGLIAGLVLADSSAFMLRLNFVSIDYFVLDLLIIGVAPAFGTIYMAKPYLSYKTAVEETYTKRMAVLRSLPISVSVLALSR